MHAIGRFAWFDLMTTDVEAAKPFYVEVAGWSLASWCPGTYDVWRAGDEPIGGITSLPDEARAAGPHWLGFIHTADVDATAARAERLGGTVLKRPSTVPEVGRFAVIADPQGAAFAISAADEGRGDGDSKRPGRFVWCELHTTDWEAAWRFYAALFGWKPTSSFDMGHEWGRYFMFGLDGETAIGGMFDAAKAAGEAPHWLHCIRVPDADRGAVRVAELGGRVLHGPADIPGGGRVAYCADPQGARFSIASGV